jgi:hypothetical protein
MDVCTRRYAGRCTLSVLQFIAPWRLSITAQLPGCTSLTLKDSWLAGWHRCDACEVRNRGSGRWHVPVLGFFGEAMQAKACSLSRSGCKINAVCAACPSGQPAPKHCKRRARVKRAHPHEPRDCPLLGPPGPAQPPRSRGHKRHCGMSPDHTLAPAPESQASPSGSPEASLNAALRRNGARQRHGG